MYSVRHGIMAAVVVAAICIFAVLPFVAREATIYGSDSCIVREEGLVEQMQWPMLAGACALMVVAFRREPRESRGFYYTSGLLYLLVCIREIDFDKFFLGDRWYDISSYIVDPEISAHAKVTLSFVFVSVAVGLLVAIMRRGQTRAWIRAHEWRIAALLFLLGGAAYFVASMLDREGTLRRHLGLDLTSDYRIYAEESLEFIGGLLLLLTAVELFLQTGRAEPARDVC